MPADTHTCLHHHFVFGTKNRMAFLEPEIEKSCHRCLWRLSESIDAFPVAIGGIADHVHILAELPPTMFTSYFAKRVKRAFSLWIKKEFPESISFYWQDGYAAFAVSRSQVGTVKRYILN